MPISAPQVVAAACECLGSLTRIDSKAAKHTVKVRTCPGAEPPHCNSSLLCSGPRLHALRRGAPPSEPCLCCPDGFKVALAVYGKLRGQLKTIPPTEAGAETQAKWAAGAGRLLYMLGQVCRFSVGVLEKGKSPPLAMRDALAVAIKLYNVKFESSQDCMPPRSPSCRTACL